jgi:hypothetical protein
MADGSTTNFDAELTDAHDARGLGAKLRSFAKVNPRFGPHHARQARPFGGRGLQHP